MNLKKILISFFVFSVSSISLISLTSCGSLDSESISSNQNAAIKNQPISKLLVLGDSLSDQGALVSVVNQILKKLHSSNSWWDFGLKSVAPKSLKLISPHFENRSFSNGPVAVELLAQKLSLTSNSAWELNQKPIFGGADLSSSQLGTNYAIGGTRIKSQGGIVNELILGNFNLEKQTSALIKQHQKLTKNDVIYLNIGSNDIIGLFDDNKLADKNFIKQKLLDMIVDVEFAINKLIKIGCQNIVVANLINLAHLPLFGDTLNKDILTQISYEYDNHLNELINKVNKNYPNTLKMHNLMEDFISLLEKFTARGKQYLLKNATFVNHDEITNSGQLTPLLVNGATLETLDNYFFFDQIHPSKWVHCEIAKKLYDLITNINKS